MIFGHLLNEPPRPIFENNMWEKGMVNARKLNEYRQSLLRKCVLLQSKAPQVSPCDPDDQVLLSFIFISRMAISESWSEVLPTFTMA